MTSQNPQILIDKLNDCEQKLIAIVEKFGKLTQTAITVYEESVTDVVPKIEDNEILEEIANVSEEDPSNLLKETEELANQLKTFGNTLRGIVKQLPDDEPIRPNENGFDTFLLEFTEKTIMRKLKTISDFLSNKKQPLTSRRSY